MIRVLVSLFLILTAGECFAGYSLNVDGGYFYSSLSDQGNPSFAMLPKRGMQYRGEMAFTFKRWDLVANGQQGDVNLIAPTGITVNDSEMAATSYAGGIRYKWSSLWLGISYDLVDSIYLEPVSTNVFNMNKTTVSFASLEMRVTATNRNLSVTADGKASFPMSTATTTAGVIKYSYIVGAGARVDWGRKFRVGFVGGVEQHKYMVGYDGYYRTDIFLGLSLGLNFGNARSNPGSGAGTSGNYEIPNYPVN